MYQNATHGNDRRRLADAQQGVAKQQAAEPPALPSLVARKPAEHRHRDRIRQFAPHSAGYLGDPEGTGSEGVIEIDRIGARCGYTSARHR